jgi:flagellar biosynthesis/type III secretory pathway protein FliH
MTNNKQQTSVEWQFEQLFNSFEKFNNGEYTFDEYLSHNLKVREQAKEMEQSQTAQLSASWAKSREQTKETALHIGFAAGFDSGLKCSEDYYEELEKTDLDEDEFSRDYILKEFEDFYTSNRF